MELLLGKGELLDFGREMNGTRISCHEGRCWITLEGDSRDHILNVGSSLNVAISGRLIVTAIGPCRLMLNKSASRGKQTATGFHRWIEKVEIVNLHAD